MVACGNVTHESFDSDKWKNWEESEAEWSLRWNMMNSLRNDFDLKELTQSEIIELLGEPDSKSKHEFSYNLGYSKTGINTGRLTIKFVGDGLVKDYLVWQG